MITNATNEAMIIPRPISLMILSLVTSKCKYKETSLETSKIPIVKFTKIARDIVFSGLLSEKIKGRQAENIMLAIIKAKPNSNSYLSYLSIFIIKNSSKLKILHILISYLNVKT